MASEIKVDTVSEKTSGSGVTIDGVNIKDSAIATAGSVPLTAIDIDGGTDIGAAIVDADLFIIDDGAGGTNRKTTASRLKTYVGGSDPASADGDSLGTASLEWSDLYLADGGVVYFGNDQEITLTHSADSGLLLKHTATADDKPINLVLQTGETDMAANDVIGKISWQAPDEGTGTDAVLVSAAIQAVAEGDHSSSSNATRIEFMVGASEAAAKKMQLTSAGKLEVDGGLDVEGGVVFNEDSADVDFRVESNGNANMLFVSGGNDVVGVGAEGDLGSGLHIKTGDSGLGSVGANYDELIIEGSGRVGMNFLSPAGNKQDIAFSDADADAIGGIVYDHSNNTMGIATNNSERIRIGSDGDIGIDNTSPICRFHAKRSNNGTMIYGENTTSSGVDVAQFIIQCNDNDGGYDLIHAKRSSTVKFLVEHDGDCQNANNSYGSTSDERIKQDITDANSQWDDIKALKVKNFKLKSDVASGNKIGVIAQDLETDGMSGLVKEHRPSAKDIEVNSDFGTLYEDGDVLPKNKRVGDVKTETSNVKTVKYSVLYMKAIKALQEAQTRIETLETKVKALEDA